MIKIGGVDISSFITKFPDKTSQVWRLPKSLIDYFRNQHSVNDYVLLDWYFQEEEEFLYLAQLVDLIRSVAANKIHLNIPYLPYARQDKDISNNETFAKHTFLKLMNSLSLDCVTLCDPHSDTDLDLMAETVKIVYPNIDGLFCGPIVFPDMGAKNRYKTRLPSVVGNKVRDPHTGYITSYEVDIPTTWVSNRDVITVVDDICDGGATFKILGQALKDSGIPKEYLNLYITHGLFSSGIKELLKFYSVITTTNSVINRDAANCDYVYIMSWKGIGPING